MGAISVLARSRWSPLAAQNMVKVKKRAFSKLMFFDASECSGTMEFRSRWGVESGFRNCGAASSP